ncbi:helix-turn-helix domain-containing protein [Nocardia jejuensis]|uniref:helix-turn-helix domain-containing protein n=1 Tax=Nocardia jejuensis TaxID=328049 RepID=UPI000833BA7B|nr:helix-turn-helix transcriptional regulator [Nocardia jejuensis]
MVTQEEFDRQFGEPAAALRQRIEYQRMELAYTFGKSVRAARESRGWSVPGLARRARVSRAEIAAIEAGRSLPAAVTERVAATVGVRAPGVLGDSP